MRIHAVFEGGGVKGIALAGAIAAAEAKGVTFGRVAGTSSGAIAGALVAAGYSGEELRVRMMEMPLRRFAEWPGRRWRGWVLPFRLLVRKGLYSAEPLERWIAGLLREKKVVTFADLPAGKLRVVASDITDGRMLVLPDDLPKYGVDPDAFPVALAVRMSAGLPYFFEPAFLGPGRKVVVDGGLLSNFPLWLFDRDGAGAGSPKSGFPAKRVPAIGFQLVGRNEQEPRRITGPVTMLHALVATMLEAHDERYIEQYNRFRTVKIPTLGVRTTQFDLPEAMALRLYQSGYDAGSRFFDRWSLAGYQKSFDLFVQKAVPKAKA